VRNDAIALEDGRLDGLDLSSYPWVHERHRIFPQIFENGTYKKILDVAAGVGVVPKRIQDSYPCDMLCNDISPQSLKSLKANNLKTVSFDLDDPELTYPFPDETFDAILSLATLEHIINTKHHMTEVRRILKTGGHLYISTPNYSGLPFAIPFLLKGRSFHNPLKEGINEYEFYAHVRYFTYKTLMEFVSSFGFSAEKVYLPLPKCSSRYLAFKRRSKSLAFLFRLVMHVCYKVLTPRWAFHPVIRFSKSDIPTNGKYRKPKKVIV